MMNASIAYTTAHSLPEIRPARPLDNQDELIRKSQHGDLEAFNALVLRYQESVYHQAVWILKDENAAEDAVQETFLHAYHKIHSYHGGSFRAWLLKITTNTCLDQIRAAKRHPWQSIDPVNDDGEELEPAWVKDPGDLPERAVERAEAQDMITRAIQKLAPEFRLAVILIDLQELDYEEACAVLNVPMGTIKSRLARAREKLREDFLKQKVMVL